MEHSESLPRSLTDSPWGGWTGDDRNGAITRYWCVVAQFTRIILAHPPKGTVCSEEKAVAASTGDRHDSTGYNLLRRVSVVRGPVAQLAGLIQAHRPKAAIRFQKKAVIPPTSNRGNTTGDNLHRNVAVGSRAVT